MKVYIAGPITGIDPAVVAERFDAAEAALWQAGHEPINPYLLPAPICLYECPPSADHPTWPPVHRWECWMRACLPAIAECAGIHLLAGWEGSRGAQLEKLIADGLAMEEIHL